MKPGNIQQLQREIAKRVRDLRQQRRWTQAELSGKLGLSQNRLSEIERGHGSFTAEQFLTILRLFNVPAASFVASRAGHDVRTQNALARLGAAHLREEPDVLPSDQLREATDVVREVLAMAASPRHITALAPVLVHNIDRINLRALEGQFRELGLWRRFAWLVENTLEGICRELAQGVPRTWKARYRRAEVVLGAFKDMLLPPGHSSAADILDQDIMSVETLEEVRSSVSDISQRWGIATRLQPDDFAIALREARVGH